MELSRIRGAAALVICVLGVGCAKVPIKELEAYRSAFSEVSAVGSTLYEEAGTVVNDVAAAQIALAQRKDKVQAGVPGAPARFDPSKVVSSERRLPDLPPPIALRVSAIQTVVAYNDALVAHVSGDPLEKVVAPLRAAVGQIQGFTALAESIPGAETLGLTNVVKNFSGLAIKMNPFSAVALDSIKTLARLGLQAKADSEMRQALLDGYASVNDVLSVLEADTEQLYGFAQVRCGLTRYEAIDASGSQTLASIFGLSNAYVRPAGGATVMTVETLEQRMTASAIAIYQPSTRFDPCGSGSASVLRPETLAGTLGSFPYRFQFAKQGKAITEPALQALDVFVAEYEGRAAQTVVARELLQNYHSRVLPDYVMLLRHAQQGLNTVWSSANRQPELAARAGEFIEIGANIRANIDSIRSATKAEATTASP